MNDSDKEFKSKDPMRERYERNIEGFERYVLGFNEDQLEELKQIRKKKKEEDESTKQAGQYARDDRDIAK